MSTIGTTGVCIYINYCQFPTNLHFLGNLPINSTEQTTNKLMTSRTAEYECDKKSYFQSISNSYVTQEQVCCDKLMIEETDKRLFTYGFKDGERLAVNLLGTYIAHMDQKGMF